MQNQYWCSPSSFTTPIRSSNVLIRDIYDLAILMKNHNIESINSMMIECEEALEYVRMLAPHWRFRYIDRILFRAN